jgi:hypothetical protein
MKVRKYPANLYIVFSLWFLILPILGGCGTVEAGAVQPEPDNPKRAQTESGKMNPAGIGTIEIGIEPTPTPERTSYTNNDYGFAFDYPETWTLTEQDHSVVLQKGTNRLGINFRWADEKVDQFGRTGMGAGDFIYAGKINFMDQVIPAEALLYEKKTKAVFYGESDPGEVSTGDIVFMIALEDLETNYMDVDLSEEIISEAGAILESFRRLDTTASTQTSALDKIGPVNIPSNKATPGVTGSSASTGKLVRRTTEEAGEMISAHLMEQNPGLMEAPPLTFEEIPDKRVWKELQGQVFRVSEGIFKNESFLLLHDSVIQLGEAIGGQGLTSLVVSDLNRDGQSELLFSYTTGLGPGIGPGIQTRVGMVEPEADGLRVSEADMAYLGTAALRLDGSRGISLNIIEANEANKVLRYLDNLGYLSIEINGSGESLIVNFDPDLPPEIKQNILSR